MKSADAERVLRDLQDRRGLNFEHLRGVILRDRIHRFFLSHPGPRPFLERPATEQEVDSLLECFYAGTVEFFHDPFFFRDFRDKHLNALFPSQIIHVVFPVAGGCGDYLSFSSLLQRLKPATHAIRSFEYNPSRIRLCQDRTFLERDREAAIRFRKAGEPGEFTSFASPRSVPIEVSPPPDRMSLPAGSHIVVLRNVLCGLEDGAASAILDKSIESLVPGGLLLLGYREKFWMQRKMNLMEVVDPGNSIYRRRTK